MIITFCTPAKGRTDFLRRTYRQNIAAAVQALGISNVRFILLDLDSPDDMRQWAAQDLSEQIRSGLVAFYRARDPYPTYLIPQADNTAMRLAVTPAISNMMADAVLSPAYFRSIAHLLGPEPGRNIVGPPARARRGTAGLITLFRSDFDRLGGYDEQLIGWGYQDVDLVARAQAVRLAPRFWQVSTVSCLEHSDHLRTRFSPVADERILETNRRNQVLSKQNLLAGRTQANSGRPWGDIPVVRLDASS
jgi:hypothetical protein